MVEVGLFLEDGTTLNCPSLSSRNSVALFGLVLSVNTSFISSSFIQENTGIENDFVLWP